MAFGSFEKGEEIEANAEINMVPFIDVMLVLLIVFMITAPLMTQAVKVDLPQASSQQVAPAGKPIELVIEANGAVSVNQQMVSLADLEVALSQFSAEDEVHFRADKNTSYDVVAQVLAAAAGAGLAKIGFVTDPVPAK